jgi:hypothetical protein
VTLFPKKAILHGSKKDKHFGEGDII